MLKKICQLQFNIKLLTGLHIGGSTDTFDIGGADSTVIKNPLNHEPYIPGSSIKGKLRSLLAYQYGEIKGSEMEIVNSSIRNIFEPVESNSNIYISRAIFRDAFLTSESRENLQRYLGAGNFTEIKAENRIKSLQGTADTPRFIERIPAGAEFAGEIILHVFDGDNEDEMKKAIIRALKLLEYNYLGGNGTRGYGKVQIVMCGFEDINENV